MPLAFLMNPAHHQRHAVRVARRDARSSSRSRGRAHTPTAPRAEYFIWGATAAMLRNLYRFLAA